MSQLLVVGSGGGGGGGIVGPLKTIYVEPPLPNGRGDDATGQRGNAALPFATLNAALAVMQDGDTISLASGTYAPPSAPIPAAVTNGVIIAPSGSSTTIIDAQGTGLPGLDFSGATRELWRIDGFRIAQDPGVDALRADGSAVPAGQFFGNGALSVVQIVFQGGDVLLRYVGGAFFEFAVGASGGVWRLDNTGFVVFSDLLMVGGDTMEISQDNDDPLSPNSGGTQQLQPVRFDSSCVFPDGTITCSEQGSIFAAPGSIMPEVNGSLLTQSIAGPYHSQVTLFGTVRAIDFSGAGAYPDVQGAMNLKGAIIEGPVAVEQTPGAVNTLRVSGEDVTFGTRVTIGEGTVGAFRTASFVHGVLNALSTVANGQVVPPTFATPPQLTAVAPAASSFVFPFSMIGTDYAVALDYDGPGDAPGYVPTRTTTGFDVISSTLFPSANTVRCIVNYYGN